MDARCGIPRAGSGAASAGCGTHERREAGARTALAHPLMATGRRREINFTLLYAEFDFAAVEYANGKPLSEILGISYRGPNGTVVHNPDRPAVGGRPVRGQREPEG